MNKKIEYHIKATENCKFIPDGSIVKAHGMPMLQKIDGGRKYSVSRDEKRKIYWFKTPISGKTIIGHHMGGVDHSLQSFARGDANCLQVVK